MAPVEILDFFESGKVEDPQPIDRSQADWLANGKDPSLLLPAGLPLNLAEKLLKEAPELLSKGPGGIHNRFPYQPPSPTAPQTEHRPPVIAVFLLLPSSPRPQAFGGKECQACHVGT